MFLGPWKHLKFFDEKIQKIPVAKQHVLEEMLKMALFKIQSSVYKLSQKMRAYLYCQLKYTYWRSFCQYFLIFICTHQAHNENFSEHQNLAKNRLFHFAGHMLCHMCATKKIFEIFFNWYHISSQINFDRPEHNIGRYRPAGSQKMPKKRPQKKISYLECVKKSWKTIWKTT